MQNGDWRIRGERDLAGSKPRIHSKKNCGRLGGLEGLLVQSHGCAVASLPQRLYVHLTATVLQPPEKFVLVLWGNVSRADVWGEGPFLSRTTCKKETFNELNVSQHARIIPIPVHVSHLNPLHTVAAHP